MFVPISLSYETCTSVSTRNSDYTPITVPDTPLVLPFPTAEDMGLLLLATPPNSLVSVSESEEDEEEDDDFASLDYHHPPLYAGCPLDKTSKFNYILSHYIDYATYRREIRRIQCLNCDKEQGPPRELSRLYRCRYSLCVLYSLHKIQDQLVIDRQQVHETHDPIRDARFEMNEPEPIEDFNGEPLPFKEGSMDLGQDFSIKNKPEYIDVFGRYFDSMEQVEDDGGQMLGGWDGPDLYYPASLSKPFFEDPDDEAARVAHIRDIVDSDYIAYCEAVDDLSEYQDDPPVPRDEL